MVRSFITVRTKEVARGCVPYKFLMPSARDLAAELLLRLDRKGGHGAAGLRSRLAQVLDEWCFLFQELDGEM